MATGGGHTRTFTYDAAGNTTYDQRTAVDGFGYTYNAANRMDTITKNGVVQAEYKYNALGQQVIRQLNGQGITINAVFDLDGNRVAEYNAQTSTLLAEYVWLNGQPIAAISGGATYFVRSDHIGRPAFATDGAGAVVWDASYKPFGEVDASTGTPINLRFPGQWFSDESDLNQNWMRDYDPTTGRYIQADPLGLVDGASVYGYVRQSPNRYTDPRGENALLGAFGGAAGTAGLQVAARMFFGGQNFKTALKCINLSTVTIGAGLGLSGGSPAAAILGGLVAKNGVKVMKGVGTGLLGGYVGLGLPVIRAGGTECECKFEDAPKWIKAISDFGVL